MKGLLLIILTLTVLSINAQNWRRAVVVGDIAEIQKNDTIILYGAKNANNKDKKRYQILTSLGLTTYNASNFNVINETPDFWSDLWFNNRAADAAQDLKADFELRKSLLDETQEYLVNAEKNNLFYTDYLLDDYFLQLINKIHPGPLNKKSDKYIQVRIIKSNLSNLFSFDNGTIIITTGYLIENTEKELIKNLVAEIANIELDYNLVNLKRSIRQQRMANVIGAFTEITSAVLMAKSNYDNNTCYTANDSYLMGVSAYFLSSVVMQQAGAEKTIEQNLFCQSTALDFQRTQFKDYPYKTNNEFTTLLSGLLNYTAWQYFYSGQYDLSLNITNRIIAANCAKQSDYLLKTKLYRSMFNTTDKYKEALTWINKLKHENKNINIELIKEEAILYIRLNDKANAINALTTYKDFIRSQTTDAYWSNELMWTENTLNMLNTK